MKTILCVLLGLVVLSSGCAGIKPATPPAQNISTNESITASPNVSQNTNSPLFTSENVVWPDTASLPFAPENVLNVNSFQFHASLFVRFSG
ncbi:MAG: hypothetical protein Q7R50_05960, partial [Dehalococcoidales bacterium]|nr:hypothetical protein [Dehalococcoidales bacterium]